MTKAQRVSSLQGILLPDVLEGIEGRNPIPLTQKQKHFGRKQKILGQFLTPPQVASFIVRFILTRNEIKEIGIDPSCGDGVFLKALIEEGFREVIGADIDPEILEKLSPNIKERSKIFAQDGLKRLTIMEGLANAVVGNPPFSGKYGRVKGKAILSNFELGKVRKSQAIEVLFLERFLQLASPNGVIGIILPQGVFSALPMEYVRSFLMAKANILGVISLPRGIFTNGTTSKTCILFAQKVKGVYKTFMGIAESIDDLTLLLEAYKERRELKNPPAFWVDLNSDSYEPQFYWPSRTNRPYFKPGLPVKALDELISDVHCGATVYGEKRRFTNQGMHFISAKNITPLGIDFARRERFIEPNTLMDKKYAHVFPGDVLFVRVGVGCSGRASVVVDVSDSGIADDWIYILRVKDISPFYLALFFYTEPGKTQIDALKHGVGTVNIPQTLLKQILIPIASNAFQRDIEKGYKEMVSLRKAGYLTKAKKKFDQMCGSIEAIVGQRAALEAKSG